MRAKFEARGEGLVLMLDVSENEVQRIGELAQGSPLSIGVEGDGRDLAAAIEKAVTGQTKLARVQFQVRRD